MQATYARDNWVILIIAQIPQFRAPQWDKNGIKLWDLWDLHSMHVVLLQFVTF